MEAWINRNSGFRGGHCDAIGVIDSSGNGYGWVFCHDNDLMIINKRNSYSTSDLSSFSASDFMDKWVFARLIINSNGKIKAQRYVDGALNGEVETTETTYSTFTRVYIFGGYDYWVDQMRVRKYVSPEPLSLIHI